MYSDCQLYEVRDTENIYFQKHETWNYLLRLELSFQNWKIIFWLRGNTAFSLTERISPCTIFRKRTDTNYVCLCVPFHNTTNCHFKFCFYFITRVSRLAFSGSHVDRSVRRLYVVFAKPLHGPSLTKMIPLEILSSFFSDRRDCWLVRYDAVQFGIVYRRRTPLTRLPGIAYLNALNVGRIKTTLLHPISLVTIYPPVCVSSSWKRSLHSKASEQSFFFAFQISLLPHIL